jgi:hypothetical protein
MAAWVAAFVLLTAVPRPVLADGLMKDDTAKAMVLLLSLSQALAQKGTPSAPAKPEAKPVPVAAADATSGDALGASSAAPATAGVSGAATPAADR